jgi:hypothetical protein
VLFFIFLLCFLLLVLAVTRQHALELFFNFFILSLLLVLAVTRPNALVLFFIFYFVFVIGPCRDTPTRTCAFFLFIYYFLLVLAVTRQHALVLTISATRRVTPTVSLHLHVLVDGPGLGFRV